MELITQLYEQSLLSSLKARRSFGLLNRIAEMMCSPAGFIIKFGDVVCLGVTATFLLISILARFVLVISDALLAALRIFFELIGALPPRLPHIALTARLLPTPVPTRR